MDTGALFQNKNRTDRDPKKPGETEIACLDRSEDIILFYYTLLFGVIFSE